MSFVKTYVHFVWSTKFRTPFLRTTELRYLVWSHIAENARSKGIFIDQVNGHAEHCHCLVSLGSNQTISQVMQLIKGESAFWINKNGLCSGKFEWQNDYFAVSVSQSLVDKVRGYIQNQELHHQKKSFQVEYEELLTRYGFEPGSGWG